jgi:hypothetical protein
MDWVVRYTCAVAFVVCAIACGSRSTPPASHTIAAATVPTVMTDRFPHAAHTSDKPGIKDWQGHGLRCEDCHDATAVATGKLARPGMAQHAPCDDCHRKEFEKPPGALCKVCHTTVDPFAQGDSPLKSYPDIGIVQALASTFSHQLHLNKGRMESATGHHVSCGDCHVRDQQSRDPQLPDHIACVPCHEQDARVKAALPMAKCGACHLQRNVEIARGRIFIVGDLTFHHATHETDRTGAPVPCTACHANVDTSASREDMAVPAMERCAQCHEDARRSPDKVRMEHCQTCHSKITSGAAPLDHMVSGGLPSDHTVEFRHDHATQAVAANANCRFCHQELSGRKEDSCFQCHNVMRPRDHNIAFRDDHGHEAEADSSRCATCHAPEVCAACHSVPPPSHTPIDTFRLGGHAEQARFNLTACLTCHTYQDTCSQCHRGTR